MYSPFDDGYPWYYVRKEHQSNVESYPWLCNSIAGVAIVIFNGSLVLHLNPWGDLLALLASVCWAVYSLLMKRISHQYSAVFITRKIFFYGLLTVLPAFLFDPWTATSAMLFTPKVVLNLLFLG